MTAGLRFFLDFGVGVVALILSLNAIEFPWSILGWLLSYLFYLSSKLVWKQFRYKAKPIANLLIEGAFYLICSAFLLWMILLLPANTAPENLLSIASLWAFIDGLFLPQRVIVSRGSQ